MLLAPKLSKATEQLIYLKKRVRLTKDEENFLYNGEQGFKGEKSFAAFIENSLGKDCNILYDVLLEYQNTYFQIDALLIQAESVHIFEIKHFNGDYIYQDQNFYKLKSKKKVKNPFHQLQRTEDLLREYLHSHQLTCTIHSYVVFNHPYFTLYQAPVFPNMILPAQQQRFMQTFQNNSQRFSPQTQKIQNLIQTKHLNETPFEYKPAYSLDQLKKGIFCLKCSQEMKQKNNNKMYCTSCANMESISSVILRQTVEYSVLFSDQKIQTRAIYQWCDEQIPMKAVRRILNKYLKKSSKTKASYFEFM
ncbi:MAG TPA: nuclease-related domain-containing protein [Pseudogracilibacillus sp.]|nr:nuclease-related domain-containing protein [Pseudogracilibacillus sp.]